MKSTILSLAGFSLLQLSVAQPFNRHAAHRALHDKRDLVTVIDTVVVEASVTPEVIIYVNTDGVPLSSTTEFLDGEPVTTSAASTISAAVAVEATPVATTSTSAEAVAAAAAAAAAVQASVQASVQVAASSQATSVASVASTTEVSAAAPAATSSTYVAPVVASSSSAVVSVPTTSTTSSAAAATSTTAASSGGYGFAYSPYMADNNCKTQDQVNQDFAAIPSGYSTVRIYGTDCNQVNTTLVAAKKYGFKIFAGVYDFASVSDETNDIISAVNGDWSTITTIAIGNEWVNNGVTDAAGVAGAVSTAKTLLTAAGYTGKIVAVDTLAATKLYPALCNNADIDYCAVNCHPFFDVNTDAAGAGDFLTTQITELRALLDNQDMEIVITETGWPSAGTSHDMAVCSEEAQTTAISSIKSAFSSNNANLFLFSTFNDYWKVNTAALYMAEQSWGYLGNAPSDVSAGLV